MSTLSSVVVLVLTAIGAARVVRLVLRSSRRALARLGWLLVRLDGARPAASPARPSCARSGDAHRRQLLRVVRGPGDSATGASGTADTEIDVPALRRK